MDSAPFVTNLYIDVTQTYVSRLATGIQRVVRKATEELLRQINPGIGQIYPVVALGDRFLLLDSEGINQLLHAEAVGHRGRSQGAGRGLAARIGAQVPTLSDHMQRRMFAAATRAAITRPLATANIAADDIVLLLDAFWGGSTSLDAAQTAHRRGATIIATIYDLIPVTHPSYMTPVAAKLFTRRLRRMLDIAHGIISISQATADEFSRFANQPSLLTEVAYCGADITAHVEIPPPVDGVFAYIAVSTLEPRKGHEVILDAFEQRWAEGSQSTLTFVGRQGWSVEQLWKRCRELETRNPRFHLIDDADDNRLADLLSRSSAAIVASKTEGFGLPVVEALARDVPVIASDIPVFREIGNDAVSFFKEGDPTSLAAGIAAFERDPEPMRAAARNFHWPTWREAAPCYAAAALRIQRRVKREHRADSDTEQPN